MDWKRVKNILIFLLLVTNAILALSIYSQFSARDRAERQAIRSAIELVSGTLKLNEGDVLALPREMYTLRVTREAALEDAFAQKLLGSGFTSESGGGGIYRYSGENGRGEIKRGGEIEFLLSPVPDDVPLDEHYSAWLSEAGLTLGAAKREGAAWSFGQSYGGYPILGYSLTCTSDSISGRWLISSSWARQQSAPTRAELVIRMASALRESGTQDIGSIRCGYYIENTGGQDSLAIPVWLLVTGGETMVFDLMSGRIIE